jgi:hypothetical protein
MAPPWGPGARVLRIFAAPGLFLHQRGWEKQVDRHKKEPGSQRARVERLGAHARCQWAIVPPSKTPRFIPSQKPIAMAAAIVIVSPRARGLLLSGHDRADVPPDVRIESEHLDAI